MIKTGATVELLNEQTGDIRQTVSNESGVFVISAVPQGRHTLKVALSGFKTVEQRGSKALLDEIPSAYKDIDEVMEQARCLVDVRHVLRQFLNVKGD
jgi:RNA-splicing ligase RtcB